MCNCRELLTVTEARNTVLKVGSFFLQRQEAPDVGSQRAGVGSYIVIRVPGSFFLLHYPMPPSLQLSLVLKGLGSRSHSHVSAEAGGKK